MWRRVRGMWVRLQRALSITHALRRRREAPGWQVGPGPKVGDVPANPLPPPLPAGMTCPWHLPCACGLCLRGMPHETPFKSRLIDPDALRGYWM
jgi:hypothetical protein